MTAERWRRVEELYHAALTRDEGSRAAFLAEACAGDGALRMEVESLLQQPASAEGFLDGFAVAMAAQLVIDPGASILTGRRLGVYHVEARIGAGGMGEVYRARDTRLKRDVAIKVLPAAVSSDPERLARFKREARAAAALNHPNILTVHDIGTQDSVPYIVSELLEGQTLREALAGLRLPAAIDYAIQIAQGLGAAHQKGIVHRDLKPENVFVTRDGRVKILDFGLVKRTLAGPIFVDSSALPTTPAFTSHAVPQTLAGVVLGTADYMSPEQVRGDVVDHRSDIFSFGVMLYEMLCGRRAFHRGSVVETMGAILTEEPPSLLASNASVPPVLEQIVTRCLQKQIDERFQSARDLAFSLDALALATVSSPARLQPASSAPSFRKITFRRGNLLHARFTPDGQTVVYSAAWDGEPSELYMTRIDGRESRRLGIGNVDLLSVSRSGELAVLLKKDFLVSDVGLGTLARVPIGGGSPREILEDVVRADWGLNDELAVVAYIPAELSCRVEYPAGQVLHRVGPGAPGKIRVSPDGLKVALVQEMQAGHDSLLVLERSGHPRTLLQESGSLRTIAWSPGGEEILFTRKPSPDETAICAVTLEGQTREIYRADGAISLCDVSQEGRLLLSRQASRLEMRCLGAGCDGERDLSWLDGSSVAALSEDGRTVVFREMRGGGGPRGGVYLRKADGGSQPVWLGEGFACDLSPDGKWVMTLDMRDPPEIVLLPTGAGRPKKVPIGGLHPWRGFFATSERICFDATGPDGEVRMYVARVDGGEPRLMTNDPIINGDHPSVSPDGRFVALGRNDNQTLLYPLEGGEPVPVQGVGPDEVVIKWSTDGRSLYLRRYGELPVSVHRLDLATGERELWRTFMPPDAVGVIGIPRLVLTGDGRFYAYTCARVVSSELFVAEGLL